MGQRGPKPKGLVKIEWSANFAYAIGLIATDGCLSKDGRHIDLTSKDEEQLVNFMKCLGISQNIGTKQRINRVNYFRVQIGDVLFYNFLLSIGFTPAKSLTLGEIQIPEKYFFDFLRGVFDGDGCSYSYFDKRWKSSYMFYLNFASSSKKFIDWIQYSNYKRLGIKGCVTISKIKNPHYQLKYAKSDSLAFIYEMYADPLCICLSRKRLKIMSALAMMGQSEKHSLTT
jgi:hypothetical protein